MKIEFNEIKCNVVPAANSKLVNLLGNATVTFRTSTGRYMTITGFTIWKSKINGSPNVQVPQSMNKFKYLLVEKDLWKQISEYILDEYERATIPIII